MAAQTLANHADKISIVAAGAVQPLVDLLQNSTTDCKGRMRATAAMANLTKANSQVQVAIAAAGAIAPAERLR